MRVLPIPSMYRVLDMARDFPHVHFRGFDIGDTKSVFLLNPENTDLVFLFVF
jgi:hypothetical protein